MSEDSWYLFLAGAASGAAEAFAVQPFDMVKTRHQLNQGVNSSVLSTLKNIVAEGGFLRLYRGMAAELVGMVPKSSGMYGTYEVVRRELSKSMGDTSTVAAIAGFASGFPESIIVTPAQVIKVRMQAKDHVGRYSNSLDCLKKSVRSEGLSCLYIGLGPTLWRNTVWNTVYFGVMHRLKNSLPTAQSKAMDLTQTFVSGFFGAVFATCFNAPFDVAKSRFQSQLKEAGNPKYRYTLQTLYLIYKEEGLISCYKGFQAKAIRMGLGGAVAMATFELVNYFF
jgi:solute carrier family 25 2-oxodicarboxylate transporter 21